MEIWVLEGRGREVVFQSMLENLNTRPNAADDAGEDSSMGVEEIITPSKPGRIVRENGDGRESLQILPGAGVGGIEEGDASRW